MVHSLKGMVTNTIYYLGHKASMLAMLDILNTAYEAMKNYNVLMQKFYQVTQERGESVSNYLIHVEGVLNDIKTKFPT